MYGLVRLVMKRQQILPKLWFSNSQMQLWLQDKDAYRARYYENEKGVESKELIFGKRIARMFEEGIKDPVLDKVPRYPVMEHRIEQKIGGVPFLGFFDSFDKRTKSILEFKTGRQPWNQARVNTHDQLVIYSLLCKLAHKKVDPIVKLVWLETRFAQAVETFGGVEMAGVGTDIEFTGRVETFERYVTEVERQEMKKKIIRTMWEIINDFKKYTTAHTFTEGAVKSWTTRKKDPAMFRELQKKSVIARKRNKLIVN